jgi:hypothetical protein
LPPILLSALKLRRWCFAALERIGSNQAHRGNEACLGLFHFLDHIGEVVGNRRRTHVAVLSQQPSDFCSDLVRAGCFLPRKQNLTCTHGRNLMDALIEHRTCSISKTRAGSIVPTNDLELRLSLG